MDENVGKIGEDLAANYLEKSGYKIIDHNYRCRIGELDIVAKESARNEENGEGGDVLVFVEVKTLNSANTAELKPEINLTPRKFKKVARVAEYYLLDKFGEICCNYRIDLVAVELNFQTRTADLRHYKNLGW